MQKDNIYQLQKKLEKLEKENIGDSNTIQIIDLLNDIASSTYSSQPGLAREYALEARKKSKKANYLKGLGRSFQVEGFSHWAKGNFIYSEKCYRKALKIYQKIDYSKGIGNAYNNLGAVLAIQGRYKTSLNCYQQCSAIYKKLNYEHGVASACANMGIIYKNRKENKIAIEYQNRALKIFKKLKDHHYQAIVHNNIGSVLLSEKQYDQAIKFFRKSLRLQKKLNNQNGAALSYRFIGLTFRDKGDLKRGLNYCLKSYNLVKDTDSKRHIMLTGHSIGEIYLKLKKYDAALKFLQESFKLSREINIKDEQYKICRNISMLYEYTGDFKKSLKFYKKFSSLKDQVYTTDYNDKIANLKIEYELEQKEKEAEIQRLKNVELVGEINKRKKVEKALRKSEERFKQLSIEDPLTGIFNRRYFLKTADKIVKRAVKDNQNLSLVIFDLDHFKEINDTFGHLEGDRILKKFVEIVKQNIRPEDIFARYGGEEFILLLINTDIRDAQGIAERIRKNSELTKLGDCSVKMTLSAGISALNEIKQKSELFKVLIKIADQKLYQAKDMGRNRVVYN